MNLSCPASAPSPSRPRRVVRGLVAALVAAAVFAAARPARADDDSESLEKKLEKQMEKILSLMRESEDALLTASRAGGKKPEGVEVKPPVVPEKPAAGATPPPDKPPASGGTTPTQGSEGSGEKAKRAIEDVLREASDKGGKVPQELEELVKMIPLSSSSSPSPQPDDPNSQANPSDPRNAQKQPKEGEEQPKPTEGQDQPDGSKPKERSEANKDDGKTGEGSGSDIPPWLVSLPEQIRDLIISGDPARVPAPYRDLIARYHRWLASRSTGR